MPSAGKEVGLSGLNFETGNVYDELLPALRGRSAINVYREMSDNDPIIGAILYAIDRLLRQVDWKAEPHPDGDKKAHEFLQECMDDMSHSWSDFISEVISMLPYGWSYFETVYKRRSGGDVSKFDDNKIGWRKQALRSQDSMDRWEFDDTGGILAMIQKPPPDYSDRFIPIQKSLLFRTQSFKNNPEGRSVLRNAYRPWYFKKRIEEIEGVGIERDLAGLPFAKVPSVLLSSDASDGEKATLEAIKSIVKNVRNNTQAGVIWPNDVDPDTGKELYTFELLTSGGSRTFNTGEIIERYDRRITMTVLADFIMLGHETVGSFALSSNKTDIFAVSLGSFLQSIEDVLNRFAVPRLFKINGMPTDNLPLIKHGDIEKPDLEPLMSALMQLTNMGMPLLPDENLETFLRDLIGIPEASPEAKEEFEAKQEEELSRLESQQEDDGEEEEESDEQVDEEVPA